MTNILEEINKNLIWVYSLSGSSSDSVNMYVYSGGEIKLKLHTLTSGNLSLTYEENRKFIETITIQIVENSGMLQSYLKIYSEPLQIIQGKKKGCGCGGSTAHLSKYVFKKYIVENLTNNELKMWQGMVAEEKTQEEMKRTLEEAKKAEVIGKYNIRLTNY